MPWSDSYVPPVQTTLSVNGAYPTPSSQPTVTSITSAGSYGYGGWLSGAVLTTPAATSTATSYAAAAQQGGYTCHSSNRGAIIALGVVCGLLLFGVAVLLFLLLVLGKKVHEADEERKGQIYGTLDIIPGKLQSNNKHHRRRARTNNSGRDGRSDDYSETTELTRGGQRPRNVFGVPGGFGNLQQFPFGRMGNPQPMPPAYMPNQQFRNPFVPEQPRMQREDETVVAPSDVGSSVGNGDRRRRGARRNESNTSSSLSRGRSRRHE